MTRRALFSLPFVGPLLRGKAKPAYEPDFVRAYRDAINRITGIHPAICGKAKPVTSRPLAF